MGRRWLVSPPPPPPPGLMTQGTMEKPPRCGRQGPAPQREGPHCISISLSLSLPLGLSLSLPVSLPAEGPCLMYSLHLARYSNFSPSLSPSPCAFPLSVSFSRRFGECVWEGLFVKSPPHTCVCVCVSVCVYVCLCFVCLYVRTSTLSALCTRQNVSKLRI